MLPLRKVAPNKYKIFRKVVPNLPLRKVEAKAIEVEVPPLLKVVPK